MERIHLPMEGSPTPEFGFRRRMYRCYDLEVAGATVGAGRMTEHDLVLVFDEPRRLGGVISKGSPVSATGKWFVFT
jgi:hypothetical protein